MALKGLIIRQPWIGLILSGQKTWEMRSRGTAVRGPIALIEKGSGAVVGVAELSASLPPLRASDMGANFDKHRIPQNLVDEPGYNWLTPWVIGNARRLDRPVPYRHKSGAVIWVDLDPDVEAAVLGNRRSVAPLDPMGARPATGSSGTDAEMAQRVLGDLGKRHGIKVPADASTSIRRKGNKLYIDVEWDDGLPAPKSRVGQWIEVIGIFAALIAIVCMLGFVIHLPLGIMSSSISALSAFKWLVPMFVSGLIATILGQGHLLEDAFPTR